MFVCLSLLLSPPPRHPLGKRRSGEKVEQENAGFEFKSESELEARLQVRTWWLRWDGWSAKKKLLLFSFSLRHLEAERQPLSWKNSAQCKCQCSPDTGMRIVARKSVPVSSECN